MSKRSFIKRILSLGKGDEAGVETVGGEELSGGGVMEASAGGEAALKPSITEILFRRRSGEDVVETPTEAAEAKALVPERTTERTTDRRASKREETALKLSEGFDNLSGLLTSINKKLDSGNERGRTLADSIEELPEVLRSIPETNRAQIEFLGTISKQLDLQTVRSGELMEHLRSLPDLLKSIPDGQRQQAEQFTELTTLLTSSASGQMDTLKGMHKSQNATLVAFQNTQNKSLNAFHKAQQQSVAAFKGSQATQARQIQEFIEKTQRSTNRVLMACAGVVGIALIGVAALIFLK